MYHKKGIGNIYKEIAKGIKDRGAEVIFDCEISDIVVSDEKKVTSVNLKLPEKRNIK